MYAVIQTGGKQYRVQEGDVLRVAKLNSEVGKKVSFDDVLLIGEGNGIKVGADAAKSSVAAEVLTNGLGKKVEIFKKRRRKHSQRTQGHRQAYTSVRITKIGAAKAAPAKKAETKSAEAKPVAKKSAAKKPEAKATAAKPAPKKEVSAKAEAKPAAKKASASATKPVAKKATAKKVTPKASSKKSDKE